MRGTPGGRDLAVDEAVELEASPDSGPASQRTTFDVAAIASIAGLHDTRGNVPLGRCVPVRTERDLPATMSREEIRVLLYLDGVTSLGEIAEETGMPLTEVVAVFLGLLAQGMVNVMGEGSPPSQVITKAR